MDIKHYIALGIIVILLFFLGREMVNHRADDKKNETKITFLEDRVDSLESAKQKVVINYDTIFKYVTKYKQTPVAVDSMLVYRLYDERYGGELDIYSKMYEDTLKTEDFEMPYDLTVIGDLKEIRFKNYKLFTKEKIVEHIVNVPVNVVKEVEKSHLYVYGMMGSAWELDNSYSWEGGVNAIFKNKFGVSFGYQWYNKTSFIKAGLSFKII